MYRIWQLNELDFIMHDEKYAARIATKQGHAAQYSTESSTQEFERRQRMHISRSWDALQVCITQADVLPSMLRSFH